MIRSLCAPVLEPAFHAMSGAVMPQTQQELLLAAQVHRRELALRRIVSFARELEVLLEQLREMQRFNLPVLLAAQELSSAIRTQCTVVWGEGDSDEVGDDSRSRSRSPAPNSAASQPATEFDSD